MNCEGGNGNFDAGGLTFWFCGRPEPISTNIGGIAGKGGPELNRRFRR